MIAGLTRARAHDLLAPVLPPSLSGATHEVEAACVAAVAWSGFQEPADEVAGLVRQALGPERALELLLGGASAVVWLREAADIAHELADRLAAALARWRPRAQRERIERWLEQGSRWRQTLVVPAAAEWPTQLADLGPAAPAALWVRGDLERLRAAARSIAMVGSRASSGYGEHVAFEAVEGLVQHGFATISGAAYGIDACVHRATMAVHGTTVAVMAGGLDRLYPAGNEAMLQRLEEVGVLVAELPSGEGPSRHRFLLRNRLIAALGSATVVVEASERSGSINTAGHAATIGRPLGAVPGAVTSGSSAGCHLLIREYGAQLVQSAAEMRELVDGPDADAPMLEPRLGIDETRVLDALSVRNPRDEQEIVMRAGLSLDAVRSTIGLLTLAGVALERAGGWVRQR